MLSLVSLYLIIKIQFVKEQNKFVAKFGSLNIKKANSAKLQRINKEILADATNN
jgi:heme exporter protein D